MNQTGKGSLIGAGAGAAVGAGLGAIFGKDGKSAANSRWNCSWCSYRKENGPEG